MTPEKTVLLSTEQDELRFSARTGALVSLVSRRAPDQEFILADEETPALALQYLDEERRFRTIDSTQAAAIHVERCESAEGAVVVLRFHGLAGIDLDAEVRVTARPGDPLSRWTCRVRNGCGLRLVDVQFPVVVCPYRLAGTPGTEAILWPFNAGLLYQAPKPQDLAPDSPEVWQMIPENGDQTHYPGLVFAQFLAYYNDRAGLFLGCEDTAGRIKRLRPVHREPGLRLGVAHVGDWPQRGERLLEYEVVLGSFVGDWHVAAGLYREWSLRQPWAARPLHARTDVPAWLLDSPPHVILRIQGELDLGPTGPNEAFLPYPKMVPLLDRLAARLETPLVAVIMSWERPGPWIYPDCFPPAGGEDSLREFCTLTRERGWHVGTFCNGTRWVVGHYWSGYDGRDDFLARGGDRSVCRTHEGALWKETWDPGWRPSYAGCLGTAMTRELAEDFVERVVGYGLDWVQFLDQNVGCATFPCFAEDHDHPPIPGQWMTERMKALVETFQRVGRQAEEESGGKRRIAWSVECPVNEFFVPSFQVCDVRVIPPGHRGHGGGFIPLYHFLYHELIIIQGGFGSAPEPYHLPIRNAYNLVIGEIPGAVMKGDGKLLNWDTMNWAPWSPDVGSDDDAVNQLRAAAALRRGPARDLLVFGRMQSPATVSGIKTVQWQHGGHDNRIPAVFHAAWTDPKGRFGVVLANWTDESQEVEVADARLGATAVLQRSGKQVESPVNVSGTGSVRVALPALGCAVLAAAG